MNNKGLTLIELLITTVVMGIIASFAVVAVGEVINNSKKDSFLNTANIFISQSKEAYLLGDAIWDDDQVTLQELFQAGYIERVSLDPWNGNYDIENSIIYREDIGVRQDNLELFYLSTNYSYSTNTSIFKITLISSNATLGEGTAVQTFSIDDIVVLNDGSNYIERIVQNITGTHSGDLSTGDDNDQVDIDGSSNGGNISTEGGDDIVNVDGNIRNESTINTGDGNDEVNIETAVKGGSTINTGDGNDTVEVGRNLKGDSTLDTGTGDDTVLVTRNVLGSTIDSGEGDDDLDLMKTVKNSDVNTGGGNDDLYIKKIDDDSNIDMGADNDVTYINGMTNDYSGTTSMGTGDDSLTINRGPGRDDNFGGITGSFDGGEGNDTLYLPKVSIADWNNGISSYFTGFETIHLKDGTLYL